ncbi:MAG: cellulase N-terminal Ig-like domain-containing protein [Opitutaceae bacterium]|nr:cellulase N-terminal Ig-like domain-containing protein [Opitutaceae bacterium]
MIDPYLPPSPVPIGFLVSQIGYDTAETKRAIVRGPQAHLPPGAWAILKGVDGSVVWRGECKLWGEIWGSHWWVADFSEVGRVGEFTLEVGEGAAIRHTAAVTIGENVLFDSTWYPVAIQQAERRQWLIADRQGWYDAGCHWQEANSHAAYLFGLCDLYQSCGYKMKEEMRARLLAQIEQGTSYLARLQDMAREAKLGDGALVHQCFKMDKLVIPGDAPKAAVAFLRVSEILAESKQEKSVDYRARAKSALAWLQHQVPKPDLRFNGLAYGLPYASKPPEDLSTQDLAMAAWAEALIAAQSGDESAADSTPLLKQLLERQFKEEESVEGLYGHFRLFPGWPNPVAGWAHGVIADAAEFCTDVGATFGINMMPFLVLLERFPQHPEAATWRKAVRDYAYGYFLPTCTANPFFLAPNGQFPGQGVIWFAGLWHGANSHYGLAAQHAYRFAQLFDDERFLPIATGNLQWIAGLNAGLTEESQASAKVTYQEVPAGTAVPVSMINGIGRRCAGSWMNIRGAICNGFSTGEQFVWDVPPEKRYDGPFRFTEEDWITHSGAWLAALSVQQILRQSKR